MRYVFKPYGSIGKLKLGMTSEEIELIMGITPTKFKRVPTQKYDADKYPEFFVYYKKGGGCQAIEFFSPAEIIFQNKNLFQLSFKENKDFFQEIDKNIIVDNEGLTSLKYGIGLYAPFAEETPEEIPEGIIIFEKGYYDSLI